MAKRDHLETKQLDVEVRSVGRDLSAGLKGLIAAIPEGPYGPSALARRVDVHRVIASKLLNTIERTDPYEVLHRIPGPDSLRAVARGAARLEVAEPKVQAAQDAIERFSALIKRFGTRSALNAAIISNNTGAQLQFEHSSRYLVYNGMRQTLGVEAEAWLTTMIFVPSKADESFLDSVTIHGALGMRRLRPDVNVYFTFGPPDSATEEDPSASPISLEAYYTNAPAALDTHVSNGQLVHRLANDTLGKHAVTDMLAVSQQSRAARRHATPDRPRRGLAIFADVPVKTLVADVLVPQDVFADSVAELIVYNPGARGPANPNDPSREIDRVEVPEQIEALGKHPERFTLAEVPNYADMVARACAPLGRDPSEFRVHRLRMAYPIHGFQYVLAFSDQA